ncbi:unnamed protein product, partial [Effrenium voratum]
MRCTPPASSSQGSCGGWRLWAASSWVWAPGSSGPPRAARSVGSLMMAYATPNSRGRLIAIFWVIFNLGGVMGGLLQFGLNFHTSGSSANPISYFTFVVVMGLGALMSPLLADPSSVVREDGTPVLFQQAESPLAELRAAIAAIGDPFILRNLLFYLASNWFYTYNFNGFNGQQFNVRSRGLNSAGFWAAQMWAAWWFGKVLDEEVAPRRRAWRGLLLVALSLAFSLGWALQAPWLPSPSGPSRAPRAPRVPRVPPAPLAPGAPPALIPQLGWRAALVVGLRLARLARLARKAKAKVAVKEVEKLELTDRVKQNHPDQQWLFGKTRPKYLEQVPEALHREVENLCDLELYLLGQQEDQTAFLAQLKSLQTSSGCRLFGVPRSSFLQRKISKLPKAELAWLSDAELLDLGNVPSGQQKEKLQEILASPQPCALLGNFTRLAFIQKLDLGNADVHRLCDLSLRVLKAKLSTKSRKSLTKQLERLQNLEDFLPHQRQVLVARLKNSQNIACDKVDDVLLKDLADEAKKMKQHAGKDGAAAKNALKRGAENGAAKKSATNGAAKNGTTNGAAKNGVAGATASASKDGKVSTEAQGAGARIGAKKEEMRAAPPPLPELPKALLEEAERPQAAPPPPPPPPPPTAEKKLMALLDSVLELQLVGVAVYGQLTRAGAVESVCLAEKGEKPQRVPRSLLSNGRFMKRLKEVLEDKRVIKVMHDCRAASDVLYHSMGIELRGVFDTKVAFDLLEGHGDVLALLRRFAPRAAAKLGKPKVSGTLLDLMGVSSQEDSQDPETELLGLMEASAAMGEQLATRAKVFQDLCQEALDAFRTWPGQHPEGVALGKEMPCSFSGQKIICHSKVSQAAAKVVLAEQQREEEDAKAELEQLLQLLPEPIHAAVEEHRRRERADPMEIVLSVHRRIEVRCRPLGEEKMRQDLLDYECSVED